LLVARCQSDSDEGTTTEDAGDIGIVGDDVQDFEGIGTFSSAPGIDTISVFPKNFAKCKDWVV
jgi:translocon-associated protein subunit alpha